MKSQQRIKLLTFLLLCALLAVFVLLLPDPPLSTTKPDDSHSKRYVEFYTMAKKYFDAAKAQPCDILFVGDSITWNWLGPGKRVWEKFYAPRYAIDFGVSADTTGNVLWRLDNWEVSNLHPKVQVILIGTNNLFNTSQQIADGVQAVLNKTQATFPGVKTILVSILPNQRANQKMMDADELIRKFADNKEIYYLNLVPLMPPIQTADADGKIDTNWKGLSQDHLHPAEEGYQIWADAMEPLLKALLAGTDPSADVIQAAANPTPAPGTTPAAN